MKQLGGLLVMMISFGGCLAISTAAVKEHRDLVEKQVELKEQLKQLEVKAQAVIKEAARVDQKTKDCEIFISKYTGSDAETETH